MIFEALNFSSYLKMLFNKVYSSVYDNYCFGIFYNKLLFNIIFNYLIDFL